MVSLNQLVERLQHLHLEQARILQALENIVADDDADDDVEHVEPNTTPVPTVVAQVPTVTAVPAPVPTAVAPEPTAVAPEPTNFHIGQRVYITNRITHVLVRRATEGDRTAIVTHFTASNCVAIHTINGFHTH